MSTSRLLGTPRLNCISCREVESLCQTSKVPEYLAHHELESVLINIIIVAIIVVVVSFFINIIDNDSKN